MVDKIDKPNGETEGEVQPARPDEVEENPATSTSEADPSENDAQEAENEQLTALQKQVDDTHDKLLRTAAELDNVRKRARRDIEEAKIAGRVELLREILPVIDSIDLALQAADPDGSAAAIIDGMEMVRKQFLSATERFGLEQIKSAGQAFDPNFHEAVAQVTSDEFEAGRIVQEMRTGYMLGDRLLRAAMVVVSKGTEAAQKPASPDADAPPEDAPEDPGETNPTDNGASNV
ncbi:MAG: nucleotide exchange factor GrpE [Myxococcota bacterium]|nr:nucleotide exchange factor GrpE [Myxococcota bacterium]